MRAQLLQTCCPLAQGYTDKVSRKQKHNTLVILREHELYIGQGNAMGAIKRGHYCVMVCYWY